MGRHAARAPAPATRGVRIRWARGYDLANRINFLGREDAFRERTVELAGIAAGASVLDVGCGTGNLTIAAEAWVGSHGTVEGIDAAPEMIREAERKAAARGSHARFRVAVVEDLPYDDDHFDVVLASLMLHHLPRDLKRRAVAEIARVLRPGGRVLVVDVDPALLKNLRVVEEAMRALGFSELERGRTGFRSAFFRVYFLRAIRSER